MLRTSKANTGRPVIGGKAVAANAVEMLTRRRNSWHFLAWAFLTVDALSHGANAYARFARSGSDDDDDGQGLHHLLADGASGDDGEFLELLPDSLTFDDGSGIGASSLGGTPPPFNFGNYLGHRIDAGGAGSGRLGTSDGVFVGVNGGGRGGLGAGGPGTGIGNGGDGDGTPADNFFTPTIDFFDGFNPFAEALGFGEFKSIADLLPDGSKGIVAAGFQFSDNPLAPILMWQSIGGFSTDARFHRADQFSAEYTVQANGFNDKTFNHMQDATNVNDGLLVQYGDELTKSLGNSAHLVDGQDWAGALIVRGNYFEFNTIVQINIIWNNDEVLLERTGDNGEPAPLVVNTGDNGQYNYAQIIEYANTGEVSDQNVAVTELTYDAPADEMAQSATESTTSTAAAPTASGDALAPPPVADALTPEESAALFEASVSDAPAATHSHAAPPPPPVDGQIFAGGFDKFHGVVQRTAIVEEDRLEFIIEDEITGNNTTVDVPSFANLNPGGHTQGNKSLIATGSDYNNGLGVTEADYVGYYKDYKKSEVQVIAGDYYEFNTIFQINLIKDNNKITKTLGNGPNYGWGGQTDVIASGGNIQLNTAKLEKNDTHDYLYVGGKYSQYNLVLQVSTLENSSWIKQISKVRYNGRPGISGDDNSGHGNGDDGDNQSFSLPSALDELTIRGQTVDASL